MRADERTAVAEQMRQVIDDAVTDLERVVKACAHEFGLAVQMTRPVVLMYEQPTDCGVAQPSGERESDRPTDDAAADTGRVGKPEQRDAPTPPSAKPSEPADDRGRETTPTVTPAPTPSVENVLPSAFAAPPVVRPGDAPPDGWIPLADLSVSTGISYQRLYAKVQSGEIPSVKHAGRRYVPPTLPSAS